MYPSSDDANAAPSQAEGAPEKKPDQEGSESALLPKRILGGKKLNVGDEISLKIVHEYEDEVEVEFSAVKGDEREGSDGSRDGDGDQMKESLGGMSSFGGE